MQAESKDADESSGSNLSTATNSVHPDCPLQIPERSEEAADENAHEANTVWWDGDADPQNPQNWSRTKKWTNVCLVGFFSFITPLATFLLSPGVPDVISELNIQGDFLGTFIISVYVLGFAIGPLFFAPLSEIYGRSPVYYGGNVGFTVFTILCARAETTGMLIACRFLSGCFGGVPVTIGGGTIGDIMPPQKRGRAMSIRTVGAIIGPVIGPVCGGFLIEAAGWRWAFWLLAIVSGVMTVASFFLLPETYAPVILARKAARLRKATGNQALRSKLDRGTPPGEHFRRSMIRPLRLLFTSRIVAAFAVYVSFLYGTYYLLCTTFTFVFQDQYGFGSSQVGLTYLGMGIGQILGLAVTGYVSDHLVKKAQTSSAPHKPETRFSFSSFALPACAIPVGLFLYGWTAQYQTHWIIPLIGTAIFGYGVICCVSLIQTYLVDVFTIYAASAIAANSFLRSIFGAFLPLAGLDLYNSLGLGWGNSLLAFISFGLISIPILFTIFGERIRKKDKFIV